MPPQEKINLFRKWWMSIDQILLSTVLLLLIFGIWISISSTPAIALKLGLSPFYFIRQHLVVVPLAIILMIFTSFLHPKHIRLLSLIGYFGCIFCILLTLFFGAEIKGARRWLDIFGFSLQPSEFIKPTLSIITAWLIAEQYRNGLFPGLLLSCISIVLLVPLLLLQPDVGMTVVLLFSWFAQLFVSGLSVMMILIFVFAGIGAIVGCYFFLPHVADRINRFLMLSGSEETDIYQVQKSLAALKNGGLFGKGAGEGVIKMSIPDSHSDFVFAVIGEEFGLLVCFFILLLYLIVILRPLLKAMSSSSMFSYCSVFGIVCQIAMQVLINISSTLNLIPTKGMTLPFLSYGGSSMLASAVSIGILIALTKPSALHSEAI